MYFPKGMTATKMPRRLSRAGLRLPPYEKVVCETAAGSDGDEDGDQAPALFKRQAAGHANRFETDNRAEDNEGQDRSKQHVFDDGSNPEWPGRARHDWNFWRRPWLDLFDFGFTEYALWQEN